MKMKYYFFTLIPAFIAVILCISCGKTIDNVSTLSATTTSDHTTVISSINTTSTIVSITTTSTYKTIPATTSSDTITTETQTSAIVNATFVETIGSSDTQYLCSTEPAEVTETVESNGFDKFSSFNDYTNWANNIGYPNGTLIAGGVNGINQDYYHTKSDMPGYDSGRIVIGDSRCCQLGIYQERTGSNDYATFAVWGGHYISGYGGIVTNEHLAEIQQCFQQQIESCRKCDVFLFATVNDYDYSSNANTSNINAALNAANSIASMTYESSGITYRPRVIIIGFDGCWTSGDLFGIPQETFNRYISDYNSELYNAMLSYENLSANASYFNSVPVIVGGKASFIDDGLHYDDNTLESICSFIRNTH